MDSWQPLKLDDVIDNKDFKAEADVYVDAVGVRSIFSGKLVGKDGKQRKRVVRETVDSIMMRVTELRAEIG